MKILETPINPSINRKAYFNGDNLNNSSYEMHCLQCNKIIRIKNIEFYKSAWQNNKYKHLHYNIEIKQFFGLDRFPNGYRDGWVSIVDYECTHCKTKYLLYADFKESRNSVYYIIMQGIGIVNNS